MNVEFTSEFTTLGIFGGNTWTVLYTGGVFEILQREEFMGGVKNYFSVVQNLEAKVETCTNIILRLGLVRNCLKRDCKAGDEL